MIVSPPNRIAFAEPAAYFAMRARLGICLFLLFGSRHVLQPRSHISVVGRVLCKAVGLWLEAFASGNHVHELWSRPLVLFEQRRIDRELQDRCRLCFTG